MLSSTHKNQTKLVSLALYGSAIILALVIGWYSTNSATALPTSELARMGGGLDITAQFSPDTVATDGVSTLTFTLNNIDGVVHAGVTLTNTLPAGITLATPANPSTSCNGLLNAPNGGLQILFESGRMGIDETCTIQVDVTGTAIGTHTNTTDNLISDMGTYGTASDDLTVVDNRPTFSLAFSPNKIFPGTVSRLSYTIDNSTVGSNVFNGSFTHQLPAGLNIAIPANLVTDCTGTFTGEAGTAQMTFYSGFFAVNSVCTVNIDVTTEIPGIYNTTTTNFTSSSGDSGAADGILDARTQPFVKVFIDDPTSSGDQVTLQYTLANYNRRGDLTDLTFTDDLNGALAGLTATDLPKNDVCGTGSTLSGNGTITLSGGNLSAEGNCVFEVTLTVPNAAATGSYTSTSSTLDGQLDGSLFSTDPAEDVLTIAPSPKISKRFLETSVESGSEIAVEFTITNTSGTESASNITFQDNLTNFIPGTTPASLPSDVCGAGSSLSTVVPATDQLALQLSNGSLPIGSSCTFTVPFQLPSAISQGTYTNTVDSLSADILGTTYAGRPASDSIDIIAPPLFQAEFINTPVLPGNTVELVYIIDHTGSDDAPPVHGANSISFTHDLNGIVAGLAAVGLPISDGCGAGSTVSGTSIVSFAAGDLIPGTLCTMTVTVQVPAGAAVGTYDIPTSDITATINGQPISGPSVTPELDISTVSFGHTFDLSTALPGEEVTLEYTITNHSAVHSADSLLFTHNLSTMLSGFASISGNLNNICGSGSALSGTTFIIFTGGTLAPNTSCTISLTALVPLSAGKGDYAGSTSNLTAMINGTNAVLEASQGSLNVDSSRLYFEKDFNGESNLPGVTSSLVYTITNLDTKNSVDTIGFTEDLDTVLAGLEASNLPLSNVCGAGSTISGTGLVTLSNGSIPAGGSCSFEIDVSVPLSAESGTYPSTSSDITGQIRSLNVDGLAASSDLEISQFSMTYAFDSAAAPNTIVPLTFNISNLGNASTTDKLAFINDLDSTLPGLTAVNLPLIDACGPGSQVSGGSTLTLSSGNLRELGSCTFTIDVKLPKNVQLDSYLDLINGLSIDGALVSLPVSTTLSIIRPEVNQQSIIAQVTDVLPGQPISYTLTAANTGVGTATDIAFKNVTPTELSVTSFTTTTTPFVQTESNGLTNLETSQILPGQSAAVRVGAQVSSTLSSDQTIAHLVTVTSTADVSTTNNSQTLMLNIAVPKAELEAESQTVIVSEEDGTVTLTITLDSPNPYAPVEIRYATADSTANSGSDFTGTTSGIVTVPAGSSSAAFTIPLVNDNVVEDSETFTVNLTGSIGGQLTGTVSANITITDSDTENTPPPTPTPTPPAPGETSGQVYLPLILDIEQTEPVQVQGPDLVVDLIVTDGSNVSVVIRNAGNRGVVDAFWVDLIIDPAIPPTKVNDTAEVLNANGLVWGIEGAAIPLAVGESLTLSLDGPYFRSDYSTHSGSIPAGSTLFAHVDSASTTTSYGAVEETHEISGAAYNNILQITTSADIEINTTVNSDDNGRSIQRSSQLPNRP